MTTLHAEPDALHLIAQLHEHNERAMALSRRGPCGTLSAEYAGLHASMNALLFRLVR